MGLVRFIDGNKLESRFKNTVIRYKGRLVFCEDVVGENLHIRYLSNREQEIVRLNKKTDDHFDETPLPLGFVNYRGMAHYCQRVPVRKWKQGLSQDNFVTKHLHTPLLRTDFRSFIFENGFEEMVSGQYPSLQDAVRILNSGLEIESVAFGREFSIHKEGGMVDLVLDYRGSTRVGSVSEREDGSALLSLKDEYKYLEQKIQGVLNEDR